KAAGVRRVDGDLIADDSHFDHVRLGDSWGWGDEAFYYNAQISALTLAPNTDYDSGHAVVEARPRAAARKTAHPTLGPATGAIKIVSTATTGAAGTSNTINVERDHGTNVVRVSGSIPLGASVDQEWTTVWEPELYAADVFRRALTAQGISVSGHIKNAA